MNPSGRGARAESAIACALIGAGKMVFAPLFNGSSRADLIFEDADGLHRVQCKSARLQNGAVVFATCSNTKGAREDYRGQVDFIGAHCAELGAVFMVPIAEVATRACFLRLGPARNGQRANIKWARDYQLGPTRWT